MTSQEWTNCPDPGALLASLGRQASRRKLRLLVCAVCRHIWEQLGDPRSRAAVAVAERFADGHATSVELESANLAAWDAYADLENGPRDHYIAAVAARNASLPTLSTGRGGKLEKTLNAAAFVAGHADRVDVSARGTRSYSEWERVVRDRELANLADLVREIFAGPTLAAELPAACRESAAAMAQSIYNDRSFEGMPILGDLLEEKGCTQPAILEHCRGPWIHQRGCWVLDLVLGRF